MIGSTAGLFGEAGHADYAAAKSAVVHGLLLSLKNEIVAHRPAGRVNVVCPGWTESPMTRTTLTDPELVRRVTRTMPLREGGAARGRRAAGRRARLGRAVRPRDRPGRDGRRRHGRAALATSEQPLLPCSTAKRRVRRRFATPVAAGMLAVSPRPTKRSSSSFGSGRRALARSTSVRERRSGPPPGPL